MDSKSSKNLFQHVVAVACDINLQGVFADCRLLQGFKLAVEKRGRHEVVLSGCQPFSYQVSIARQIYYTLVADMRTDYIPVLALQGGASDHDIAVLSRGFRCL